MELDVLKIFLIQIAKNEQAVRLQMLCDSPEAFVKGGSGSFAV
jgi:hypothetical protein